MICIAICCCSEAPAPEPALEPTDAEQTKGDTSAAPRPATKPPRLLFLDNLKSAFTAIVVVFHATCTFAGSGFYYNVGNYYSSFQPFAQSVLLLFQCFFM